MALYGYIRKGQPANWLKVKGAQRIAHAAHKVAAPKPRKPIRHANPRKTSARTLYRQEAAAFVAAAVARGERCPVVALVPSLRDGRKYGHPISDELSEVHHCFGRIGMLLRWQPGWTVLSKQGHRFVHANIQWSMAHGFIGPTGTWNDYQRAKAFVEKQQQENNK